LIKSHSLMYKSENFDNRVLVGVELKFLKLN